jgi:DNA-binding IclR family transcriptional regulator
MRDWNFLTNHARTLLLLAEDPDARLRDIAAALEVTERTAFGLVADLTESGYVVKERDGRRNRYRVQAHLPVRDVADRQRTVGDLLAVLSPAGKRPRRTATARDARGR